MANLLSRLFDSVRTDLERDFGRMKKSSILAVNDVRLAQEELKASIQRAADLAEAARSAAEAAANDANQRAQLLAQEAKAAAERAEYHRNLLTVILD
jgi:hypothetical protein